MIHIGVRVAVVVAVGLVGLFIHKYVNEKMNSDDFEGDVPEGGCAGPSSDERRRDEDSGAEQRDPSDTAGPATPPNRISSLANVEGTLGHVEEDLQAEMSYLMAMEQANEARRRQLFDEERTLDDMQRKLERRRNDYEIERTLFEETMGRSELFDAAMPRNSSINSSSASSMFFAANAAELQGSELLWEAPAEENASAIDMSVVSFERANVPMFPMSASTSSAPSLIYQADVSEPDTPHPASTDSAQPVTTTAPIGTAVEFKLSEEDCQANADTDSDAASIVSPSMHSNAHTEDSWSEIEHE